MAITPQAIDFLSENRLNNSKEWFDEHRAQFNTLVRDELLALSAAIGPVMQQIDPDIIVQPGKTISRVRRDTRFTHDKSLFRDCMWVTFHRGKGFAAPTFFFEFSPQFYRYGCGYYKMPTAVKREAEQMILADHKLYLAAQKALDALPHIPLDGETYKRTRFADAPPHKADWLERKDIGVCHTGKDSAILFGEDLGAMLADTFEALAPLYQFLLQAHIRSGEPMTRR